MTDGTRTRDILDHNQVLYQLNYGHHARTWIARNENPCYRLSVRPPNSLPGGLPHPGARKRPQTAHPKAPWGWQDGVVDPHRGGPDGREGL